MKLFKNKKTNLFLTLGLSLLSVFAASVSTLSWFQITDAGKNVTKENVVTTGSSDLSLDSITGYKSTYDESGYGETDYTNGHVTPYNFYTKNSSGANSNINVNQGGVSSYDIPSDGIGYYIVGDSSWCLSQNKNESYAWKYAGGIRMDEDTVYGNKAILNNIHLVEGSKIKIRHYYINTSGNSTEDWINTLDNNSYTTTAAEVLASGNMDIQIKTNQSGYYNLYFTTSNQLSFYPIRLDSTSSESGMETGGMENNICRSDDNNANNSSKKSSVNRVFSGGWYVYLNLCDSTNEWESNSATFGVKLNNDNSKVYKMNKAGDSHYYYYYLPSGSYTNIQIVRRNSSFSTDWNYSTMQSDLYGKNCFKIDGWDTTSIESFFFTSGTFGVIGTINGSDWNTDYEMYLDLPGGCLYRYVQTTVANQEFKVRKDSNWDNSYPTNNYQINTTGYHLIKLSFSLIVTCTDVNYQIYVFNSSGSYLSSESQSLTLNSDGKTFSISNKTIYSTYKFKLYQGGNYYGYDNCTINVDDSINGFIYNAGSSDNYNIKCAYKGTYSITFLPYESVINISGSLTNPSTLSPSVTYYLEAIGDASSWNNTARYAVFIINEDGINTTARWIDMTKTFSGSNVYQVTVGYQHTKMIFVRLNNANSSNNFTNKWNQTVDISKPSGTLNYYIITSGSGDTYTGSWNNFYGQPDPNKNGYYLVGTQAFTGSQEVEWSFTAARKMDTGGKTPNGTSVTASLENLTLRQGMEFQIWIYNTNNGRETMYNGSNLSTDTETQAIAKSNASNNIEIKEVTGTKFGIYLTSAGNVMIIDNEKATDIFFNVNLKEHETNKFTMGYGDSSRLAIYELGISITETDITNGAEFTIRRRARGNYTWYYYNDGNGSYNGLFDSTSKDFVEQGASHTFGEGTATRNTTGFKFITPGSYKIYLMSNGTIAIAQMPGAYGEGYYIIPYNESYSSLDRIYTNGVKMKAVESVDSQNIAVYTCYSANAGDKIFFNYYINGVENYNTYKKATQRISALSTAENDHSTEYASFANGILEFSESGSYNIFLYRESGTNDFKISLAKYNEADFFKLNSIDKSCSDVKSANTSMVLEVDFTSTNVGYGVTTSLDLVVNSSATNGLSNFIKFTYVLDPTLGNLTPYEYMRQTDIYNNLSTTASQTNVTQIPSSGASGTTHKILILIDYNSSRLSDLPSTVNANFKFVLKITQAS